MSDRPVHWKLDGDWYAFCGVIEDGVCTTCGHGFHQEVESARIEAEVNRESGTAYYYYNGKDYQIDWTAYNTEYRDESKHRIYEAMITIDGEVMYHSEPILCVGVIDTSIHDLLRECEYQIRDANKNS